VYVFREHRGRSAVWTDEYRQEVKDAFKKLQFDPATDHLVAVGHQIPLVVALGVLIPMYGVISVLLYYPPEQKYIPMMVGDTSDERRSEETVP
jgi:hypothetical protein